MAGDYEDHFDAEENDIVPLVEPTKELIDFITTKSKEKIDSLV